MELTSRMKIAKILNLLDPDAEKQTFGRKSQNWPNLRDKNGILLINFLPINKLNGPLGLNRSNRRINVFRNNITAIHQTTRHIFPMSRVTFCHHTRRLKNRIRNFRYRQLFMIRLFSRYHRGIRGKHKMNTRVWHKICLELGDVNVNCSIET
ncbi:hypothetical protein Hanom_Chr02g00173751 [Helianthus anomalus]